MTPAIDTRVARLETALNALPQVDCPVRHYFAPGLFAREITIPAGTCLVGAVHKTENLAVLSAGRLRLVTEVGTSLEPFAMAGAKNDDKRLGEVYAKAGVKVVEMHQADFDKWLAVAKRTSGP